MSSIGCALILPSAGHAVVEVNAYVPANKSAYECVARVLERPARTVSIKFDYSERYDPEKAHPEFHAQGLIFPPLPFIAYSYRTNAGDVLAAKLFVFVGDRGEFELGYNGIDELGHRITPLRASDMNPYFELTHDLWKECHAAYSGDIPAINPITVVQTKPANPN